MGISNYLNTKAAESVIRDSEKGSIQKSIRFIKEKIDSYFDNVENHFIFGSYTRNTILPRSIDEKSDIDYMVVFENDDATPQTYLNRLRKFVKKYYSQSEIKQSHPTIQLELNHITFELVPTIIDVGWFGSSSYQIPSKIDGEDEWIDTDPNGFNEELTEANKDNKSLIKPLIRLLKHWNTKHGYIFESFLLEKDIVSIDYFWMTENKRLKDYFYKYIESMEIDESLSQWKQIKIENIKNSIKEAKEAELENNTEKAENIIRKIFKDEIIQNNTNSSLVHIEQPKWEIAKYYNISIFAKVDGDNFSSGEPLDKNLGLRFDAITTTPKPYNVFWQIVNTGRESINANCLRGEITPAKSAGVGGLNLIERTAYTGNHWVECFIVKNNICVARSGQFKVNIK